MQRDELLALISRHYLDSRDFNGLPVRNLDLPLDELRALLAPLIEAGLVSVNFGDRHCNPHILAFEPEPTPDQIAKLAGPELADGCLYPTTVQLQQIVPPDLYADQPFRRLLALGHPQLSYRAFDLGVLEAYRNDPRYLFSFDDISGSISIRGGPEDLARVREADQVLMESFGFAYNRKLDRAVAVFLRYLVQLSPEHQQIWRARMLDESFELHPDYLRRTMGDWGTGVSMFSAFLAEIGHVNALAALMGRPPLFRDDYKEGRRPRSFGFLLRPTRKEFDEFVHLLDRMISDNIDQAFFQGEVTGETEIQKADGKVALQRKGTIQMLGEWLAANFEGHGAEQEQIVRAFRKVRQMRQRPAHAIAEDVFDQAYIHQQRELMAEAFMAMNALRRMLQTHDLGQHYEIPRWLEEGRIWKF